MSDIDRKKKELIGLIIGLMEVEEHYGYMRALDDTMTHEGYPGQKELKAARNEIKVIMDEIRKIIEEL
jgi:hypothetical protein